LGCDGLLTAPAPATVAAGDWAQGENAFSDVAAAIELLTSKASTAVTRCRSAPISTRRLHRLQPGTGLLEIERE
jgi:hypothetical protein